MSSNPKVTFVVPCYKLAHLLRECIDSILSQTYTDFEVLIMDDCSPDDTPAVAQSFSDPRVKYCRNNPNLGHLKNYNKGIGLAKGEYVWLISADDRLRRPYILEKYIEVMESHPNVGYVFCPAMGLQDGQETKVIHSHGAQDTIVPGRAFLQKLLDANSVVAASGMARRDCYEKIDYFPTDMPWGGDWYLWCVFALHYDVAYLAEPMVHYRTHGLSMTTLLTTAAPRACTQDDLVLPWRVKQKAAALGYQEIVKRCRHMIAYESARSIVGDGYESSNTSLTVENCEALIEQESDSVGEAKLIRSRLYACLGDRHFWARRTDRAAHYYLTSIRLSWCQPKVWAKYGLARWGGMGLRCRETMKSMRKILGARTSVTR